MLARAAQGAAEGAWLIADAQDAGRGRMGREWRSPPGNLYTSGLVRLRPGDPPAATLALAAGVAAHEALSLWADGLSLKWPNDVLRGDAKLAGLLLERAGDAVVVGIGANLAHHPDLPDRRATSIGAAAPAPLAVAEALAEIFERRLTEWRDGLPRIRAAWLDRAHPVGTALCAQLPDRTRLDGLFDGLTEDCALRLRLADGSARVIHAGDVFLI